MTTLLFGSLEYEPDPCLVLPWSCPAPRVLGKFRTTRLDSFFPNWEYWIHILSIKKFSSTINTFNLEENCPIWDSSNYQRLSERGTITEEPNMDLVWAHGGLSIQSRSLSHIILFIKKYIWFFLIGFERFFMVLMRRQVRSIVVLTIYAFYLPMMLYIYLPMLQSHIKWTRIL